MRTYEEFEQLLYSGGDMLFSAVLTVTDSREKAMEVIIQASEKYMECHKILKNSNDKYRCIARFCEQILKVPLTSVPHGEYLTDDERDKVLSAVRIYINAGGKDRKRLWMIITAGVFLVILALIVACKLEFISSDEFNAGWAEWYKKQEEYVQSFLIEV